jgi:hypothetical protein
MIDAQLYLGSRYEPYKNEIKLFPFLDESDPTAWAMYEKDLQSDRFRWLCKFYRMIDRELLYTYWIHPDPVKIEMDSYPSEGWEEFKDKSIMLGIVALREEPKYFPYYKALKAILCSRVRINESIFVYGITAGGEIEAACETRGTVVLQSDPDDPKCLQAESRAMTDGLVFDTLSRAKCDKKFQYVLLSPYSVYERDTIIDAYTLLGDYGYILFPSNKAVMYETAEELGLIALERNQNEIGVFFKHPGML